MPTLPNAFQFLVHLFNPVEVFLPFLSFLKFELFEGLLILLDVLCELLLSHGLVLLGDFLQPCFPFLLLFFYPLLGLLLQLHIHWLTTLVFSVELFKLFVLFLTSLLVLLQLLHFSLKFQLNELFPLV